jgi:hypothetical protein
MNPAPIISEKNTLLSITWSSLEWSLSISISYIIILVILAIIVIILLISYSNWNIFGKSFDIDHAEFGLGNQKIKLKPTYTDKQVAYAIWVELSTRKIGLPIDFDNDVISEIYDSWYNYFSVTRELIKGVPVNRFKDDSTQQIIKMSIAVLNDGLRPHLTQWQARFRAWHNKKLKAYEKDESDTVIDPQSLQQQFPEYQKLKEDMERVNANLIAYRNRMRELVLKD